jgi:hypothetical protein
MGGNFIYSDLLSEAATRILGFYGSCQKEWPLPSLHTVSLSVPKLVSV